MTLGQWFAGVFDRALARWVSADPVAAETKVAGLLDKVIAMDLFWNAVNGWLDANPDKVQPFVVRFLDNVAAQGEMAP